MICVARIMDQKQQKKKWMLPALLLKSAKSPVSFGSTPPITPVVLKAPARQLSGPPLIPKEACGKARDASFMAREPTSPKISCMGQIQYSKKKKKKKKKKPNKTNVPKKITKDNKLRGEGGKEVNDAVAVMRSVPSLGELKRFSSGRSSLEKFDLAGR